jgi:outer membrane receptor for ferrienterochelin and colicins
MSFGKAIFLLLVFLQHVPELGRAGSLSGKVTDQSNGAELGGATVIVKLDDGSLKPQGAKTHDDGTYEITEIPQGEYRVTVSYLGFQSAEFAGIQITQLGITTLNAGLRPAAITLDAISVTASRRPEKVLEAPSTVSLVGSENIQARTTLALTEHIKGLPGVDVSTAGLNQSSAVVRGFNNIFSGALLVLTDNRIAGVPSLRFNAYNFIPTVNEDIDRIEIVSGPGSALYGPNSANGVMQVITKSPFASPGTTVSIGYGEREVFMGSFHHAKSISSRVGYKISGQYYRGNDWESFDPLEPDSIQPFRPTSSGPEPVGGFRLNRRDFQIEKISGDARFDFLFPNRMYLILNGAFNRATDLELTDLGAAQAIDWTYTFAQARLMYKNLFVQGYINASDAGDTYLLRTGQLIVDRSKLWAWQIQHQYVPGKSLTLTYGLDAILTRPNTQSTINGRNEDQDHTNELGLYLQGDKKLSEKLRLIGAARIDHHNKLKSLIFSPRTALAYQPGQNQNLRVTYNRAYNTPYNTHLFLDILQADDPFSLGATFGPVLGFRPDIDIRVQGVPENGFHWSINGNGPQFRSSFAPLDTSRGLSSTDFIDFNDSIFTNVMWSVAREAVISAFDTLSTALRAVTPLTLAGVKNALKIFNPADLSFHPSTLQDIANIDGLKPTITQTMEIGYKGVWGERLRFGVDVYLTKKHDFIGPLRVETPNVFLDSASLWDYLTQEFARALADSANAAYADSLAALDTNGNGPVDELTSMFVSGPTQIPFGTVSPRESLNPQDVLVTFRNFGDVILYGTDISFACHLNKLWNFGGSYSYVSKNYFKKSDDPLQDIYLNAPKHKFGIYLQYSDSKRGLAVSTRLRFVDAFKMSSPFIGTTVKSYTVVDLNLGYNLPFSSQLSLTVQNLLDHKHAEFIGAPRIGRLALMRITRSF